MHNIKLSTSMFKNNIRIFVSSITIGPQNQPENINQHWFSKKWNHHCRHRNPLHTSPLNTPTLPSLFLFLSLFCFFFLTIPFCIQQQWSGILAEDRNRKHALHYPKLTAHRERNCWFVIGDVLSWIVPPIYPTQLQNATLTENWPLVQLCAHTTFPSSRSIWTFAKVKTTHIRFHCWQLTTDPEL